MTGQIKQGDEVRASITGTYCIDEVGAFIRVPDRPTWRWAVHPAATLELLTPAARPLEVGETVLVETGARRHEVVHIRGGFAWVDPLDPPNHYLGKVVLINTLSRPGPNPTPISQPQ